MTASTGPIRVIVCDDQALVRAGFETILTSHPGLEVVGQAGDGRTAVQLARQLHPDVVVMDIRMPVLDGIEATRQLAGPGVQAPAKVLIVTTFNVDEYVFEALQVGASGFLLKDSTPTELVHAIQTVATGDALLAPAVTRHLIGRYAARVRPADQTTAGADTPFDALTPREREVLQLIATGQSNAEIAATLTLSPETVKTHVSRTLTKLGLRDRVQAVVMAYRFGLVDPRG